MFEIDPATIKAHLSSLKVAGGSLMAPRQAVAALLTLAPEPESVLTAATSDQLGYAGRITWTLLARYAGGIAIVTADAERYADWGAFGDVEVKVTGTWVPLSSVESIGLSDIKVRSRYDGDGGGIYGERSWALHVKGAALVVLPPNDSEEDRQAAWFAALQRDLT